MAQAERNVDRKKLKKEANEAADRLAAAFPPEGTAPFPMAAGMHAGSDAMKHWMETSANMAQFYTSRMGKQLTHMTELATCRSPAQFAAVCARVASETAHDYADQVDRVMAINLNGYAEQDGSETQN